MLFKNLSSLIRQRMAMLPDPTLSTIKGRMFDIGWIFSCVSHQQSANYSRRERLCGLKLACYAPQDNGTAALLSANAIINTVTTILSLLIFTLPDTHMPLFFPHR